MKLINLSGKTFGRLTVTHRLNGPSRRVLWACSCSCGKTVSVISESLLRGLTSSCGCLRSEATSARSTKHGFTTGKKGDHSKHLPEYRVWSHAKGRCFNPTDPKYAQYGGRGITMCTKWKNSFPAFLRDMGRRPLGMTLDRINNDGNYEPNNCRWATAKQQQRNKQQSIFVEYEGRVINLKDLADELGVEYKRFHLYVRGKNIPLEEAIRKSRS